MSAKNTHKSKTDQSRRNLLQATAAGLLTVLSIPVLPRLVSAVNVPKPGGVKALIVYYSYSGNTRRLAGHIHAILGAALVELEPVEPYPAAYRATTEQAKRELETGYKPPLKTNIDTLSAYAHIVVGSPNWWGTVAAPVKTFLSDYDLSGKIIAPFITHEGSGLGRSIADIKALCPKATITEGLAVRGSKVETGQEAVTAWLRTIGMSN